MFDSARALERPEYYRSSLKFLADRGVNTLLWHFTDDQGCAMQFDSVPGMASPHAYSKSEMRDLVLHARELGIELIPEVATLGHTGYLTRLPAYRHLAESDDMFSSLCPVAAETRPIIQALIEEAAAVFDSPNFHVGLDETNFGDHPLSIAALASRSRTDIFAEHINFVHGVVTGLGRRMWMWADGLLKDPALAERLPRDIVMCNWKYRPVEPVESTQYLLDQGFSVVCCSATISSQQMMFPGNRFALPNIRSLQKHVTLGPSTNSGARVLGQITTIWTPVRYLANALWLGVDLSLELMRDGPSSDDRLEARIAQFGKTFYGLTETSSFIRASMIVVELSPCRDEWLSVLRLEPQNKRSVLCNESIARSAPLWAAAEKLLDDKVRPLVREHVDEFDTFCLMVRLVSNAYSVAADRSELTPAAADAALLRKQQLLAEIEATWDRERYPDDPRKFHAPVRYFDDDHLIPVLRDGLQQLALRQVR